MKELKINGQTAAEWAAGQFESEYCAECGGDAEHHVIVKAMGNWFAKCKYGDSEPRMARIVVKYIFISMFASAMEEEENSEKFPEYSSSQQQLENYIPSFLQDYDLSIDDFTKIDLGLEIIKQYNAALGGKITLADLWEDEDDEEMLPYKLAMDVQGHGVGIWDEEHYVEQIESAGAEVPNIYVSCDVGYDAAWNAIQKMGEYTP